jgi:hypothetical protein
MGENDLAQRGTLLPVFQRERKPRPFYGFAGVQGMFADSKGNQCGVIRDAIAPCQMEIREKNPDWRKCPYNTLEARRVLDNGADDVKVFPDEFMPQGVTSWGGISFRQWYEYVMRERIIN